MRHHAFAAAMGLLTAAILAPVSPSHAASADPTGYWKKPDAERESKIQVFKCGTRQNPALRQDRLAQGSATTARAALCTTFATRIPRMRGRPIVGLPIFSRACAERAFDLDRQDLQSRGRPYLQRHADRPVAQADPAQEAARRGCSAARSSGCGLPPPEVVKPPAPAEGTQQIEASVDAGDCRGGSRQLAPRLRPNPSRRRAPTRRSKASIDAAAAPERCRHDGAAERQRRMPAEPNVMRRPRPEAPVEQSPEAPKPGQRKRLLRPPSRPPKTMPAGLRLPQRLRQPRHTSAALRRERVEHDRHDRADRDRRGRTRDGPAGRDDSARSSRFRALHQKPTVKPKPIATAAAKPVADRGAAPKPRRTGSTRGAADAAERRRAGRPTAPRPLTAAETAEAAMVEPVPLTRRATAAVAAAAAGRRDPALVAVLPGSASISRGRTLARLSLVPRRADQRLRFRAQLLFRQLADHGLRQLVAELDLRRQLDLGELASQELEQLRRRRRLALLQLHEGLRRFAAILVGNADHGHLGDRAVRVERILDPPRIDLEARGVDHVLDAVDDEDVSRPRPCSRHRRCGRSARRSSLRSLPACSNSRSSPAGRRCRSRRARRAALGVRIVERADGDLGGREGKPDRPFLSGLGRIAARHRRGLAQAVAFDHAAAAQWPRIRVSPRAAAPRHPRCNIRARRDRNCRYADAAAWR